MGGLWCYCALFILFVFIIYFCCMSQCLCLTYDVPCSSNFVALIVFFIIIVN